jgi:hypothetical protein
MTTETIAPAEIPPEPQPAPIEEPRPAPVEPLGEDDQPRQLWERAIGWGIVALATLLVWLILDQGIDFGLRFSHYHGSPTWLDWIPTAFHTHFKSLNAGLLFTNTTTNGGDMGAHVWWPWFLEHNWFTHLRLSGWAPDWYAGFPVGQYYFPMPAIMVAVLNAVMPYNIAFKLVTVSGPVMLPAAAYYFAKGLRTPWPAPPAFAIAAFGMLVETRDNWNIYGGNIASTLAGEFSFTIGLAFALFGLGALAHTLDTGKRRWLPAVLIAAAIMSHIVIAAFVVIAATLLWLTRRPKRTWPLAVSVGFVAVALTAVWSVPLVADQAYTQSMRYGKLFPVTLNAKHKFAVWSWLNIPNWLPLHDFLKQHLTSPIRYTVAGLWQGISPPQLDPNGGAGAHWQTTLQLPWWMWILAGAAIVAAGWYRRRSTFVLLLLALIIGIMFIEWPDGFAVWNTRFLPFWLLTWGLIAAMGATEIVRAVAAGVGWAYRWIRDGDLQDARARAWAERATNFNDPTVNEEQRKDAAWALAERRFDANPAGWEPPAQLAPERVKLTAKKITTIALSVLVVIGGIWGLSAGWDARDNKASALIADWAKWNYSGYEMKPYPDPTHQYKTSQEFFGIMTAMNELAAEHGDGRLLWEPGDALNAYGTTLAPELIPYYTHGKIDSMEGLYFESSATTAYHFLTVSECGVHPSNPVRGLVYGTISTDFDLCVKHLQMLGVRYLMLWTSQAEHLANANPQLTLVKTIPDVDGQDPKGWKVYQVADSDQIVGMSTIPFVVTPHGGKFSKCWNTPYTDTSEPEDSLPAWECSAATWWMNRNELDTMWAASGPKDWQHIDSTQLASAQPQTITPANVTNAKVGVHGISFDVDQIGKPVEIKVSYFPNWQVVHGAKGPYRLAPNLMVVIPTSNHVSLTYGLTGADWVGRILTVVGIAGVVALVMWKGAVIYAADGAADEPGDGDDSSDDGHDGTPSSGGAGEFDEPVSGSENDEGKASEPALP